MAGGVSEFAHPGSQEFNRGEGDGLVDVHILHQGLKPDTLPTEGEGKRIENQQNKYSRNPPHVHPAKILFD
jgi:hypothetical protein